MKSSARIAYKQYKSRITVSNNKLHLTRAQTLLHDQIINRILSLNLDFPLIYLQEDKKLNSFKMTANYLVTRI